MNDDVLDYLKRKLLEDRGAFLEQLGRGMADDYAEYRFICGSVVAIDSVIGAIDDIRKKLEHDSE